jgi:hypothetical protein
MSQAHKERTTTMRTNEARHMGPGEDRRRRRWPWAAGSAVALLLVGAVVAYALLQLTANITGGGSIDAPPDVDITAANVWSEDDVDCQVSVAGGDMTLQMADGLQGGTCDVDITLKRTGQSSPTVKVAGIDFSTATSEAFVGSSMCGKDITTAGTVIRARFTLTGAPGTFTASPTAGIVTTDGSTTSCPVA